MGTDFLFTEEEMAVDEGRGYPKAFAKLCRDRRFGPFSHGPPFTFAPYALVPQEESRAKALDEMFEMIDPKAKPTAKPKIFLSLLWKQLNHLGNAGFDPELIRVDQYGNVLYYHADAASPLAWDIDHWFPCSRGGLTVPSNLRILQWQVSKRKHNKLEFLIPWWDLQLGISINQFLSIFASSNSDFRCRAFSWLFSESESEQLNASQTVDYQKFPQHFLESNGKLGLAPAAVVLSGQEHIDAPFKSLDLNRRPRSSTPIVAVKKGKQFSKENTDSLMVTNPYQAIVMARDSLRQREETVKMQAEIHRLDNEVSELQQKSEEEKLSIEELELVLIKKRRQAEKCRQLAESQTSYRATLEKMIRDAMHQSVVYKEQVRLNQAAASALLARLEAQKAICDYAERDLHRNYRQRDELEKQMRPEQRDERRKRSRMDDNTLIEEDNRFPLCLARNESKKQQELEKNDTLLSETANRTILCLPEKKSFVYSHRELIKLMKEERRASAESSLENKEREQEEIEGDETTTSIRILKPCVDKNTAGVEGETRYAVEERVENLGRQEGDEAGVEGETRYTVQEMIENLETEEGEAYDIQFPFHHERSEEEEDEESRRRRGKGNIEKWLQFLLQDSPEDTESDTEIADEKETSNTDELIKQLSLMYPRKEIKFESDEEEEGTGETKAKKLASDEEKEYNEENVDVNVAKNHPYRLVQDKTKGELISIGNGAGGMSSPDEKARKEKVSKERELLMSEGGRPFRLIPTSPSHILGGMKKRVDCIGRKPLVLDDDNGGDEEQAAKNSFIKSSIKTIKKAARI